MRLRATDQILVTSVRPSVLAPGEEFEVSEALGKELLRVHPRSVAALDAPREAPAETPTVVVDAGSTSGAGGAGGVPAGGKADAPLPNKAEEPPLNKAEPKRRKRQA